MPHSGKYTPRIVILSGIFTLINAGLYVYYDTELIPAFFYFLVMGAFMVVILQSLEDMGAVSRRRFAAFALDAANPSLTTPNTRKGLIYTFSEGRDLEKMLPSGEPHPGDGKPWLPEIKVKGGNSAFYSIGVGKGE